MDLLYTYLFMAIIYHIYIQKNLPIFYSHRAENYANITEVVAGTKLKSGGTRYKAERIINHEQFGPFKNDIALVQIKGTFQFSNTIKSIDYARKPPPIGASCMAYGWGRTGEVFTYGCFLK